MPEIFLMCDCRCGCARPLSDESKSAFAARECRSTYHLNRAVNGLGAAFAHRTLRYGSNRTNCTAKLTLRQLLTSGRRQNQAVLGLDLIQTGRSEPKLTHKGLEREFSSFNWLERHALDVCTGRNKACRRPARASKVVRKTRSSVGTKAAPTNSMREPAPHSCSANPACADRAAQA
jgi:hypothetical protein